MGKFKINDKLTKKICNDIKAGVPILHACIAHGISKSSFYNWYDKGKNAKTGQFRDFYDSVNEAKSVAVALRARRIYKAGETIWQADAWWLERADPEHFGRKDHVQVDANAKIESKGFENLTRAFEESKRIWEQNKIEEETNSN